MLQADTLLAVMYAEMLLNKTSDYFGLENYFFSRNGIKLFLAYT